jgi:excisionase family DNA binding protein
LRTSERLLLSVEEAAARLGISRAYMWRLVSGGDVESMHVGRLRRIEPEALARYIARIRGGDPPPAA